MKDYSEIIRKVLVSSGIPFREASNRFIIRCINPRHPDKAGKDMSIYKDSAWVYCFSCQTSMSLKTFAKEVGREDLKIDIHPTEKKNFVVRDFEGFSFPSGFKKFNHGLEELEVSPEMSDLLEIGYCSYGLDGLVDLKKCSNCSYKSWISGKKSICEFAFGRAMFPIIMENKILAIESRDLTRLASNKVLYPKGSKVSYAIYNYSNLDRDRALYVVEGIKSAMKIYRHFDTNVTAIFSNRLKGNQRALLEEFKHIIAIPDVGRAGEQTIEDLEDLCINRLEVVKIPEILLCKDCGKRMRKRGSDTCSECGKNNLSFCDIFDFSVKKIKEFIDNRETILDRRRDSWYNDIVLNRFDAKKIRLDKNFRSVCND